MKQTEGSVAGEDILYVVKLMKWEVHGVKGVVREGRDNKMETTNGRTKIHKKRKEPLCNAWKMFSGLWSLVSGLRTTDTLGWKQGKTWVSEPILCHL